MVKMSRERFVSTKSFYLARDKKKYNAVAAVLFIIIESALFHRCSSGALTQMAGGTALVFNSVWVFVTDHKEDSNSFTSTSRALASQHLHPVCSLASCSSMALLAVASCWFLAWLIL
jgi:hypothetical protein